jgi:hypothetical protein
MAAADAAPGGGLLCAEAHGAASASMRATPIKAKITLRIVGIPTLLAGDDGAKVARLPLYLGARPGALSGLSQAETGARLV